MLDNVINIMFYIVKALNLPENPQKINNRLLPQEFMDVTAGGPKNSDQIPLCMSRVIQRLTGETTP